MTHDSATTINKAPRMLGLDLDGWNLIAIAFLVLTTIAGGVGAASTYIRITLQKEAEAEKNRQFTLYKMDTEKQIENAKAAAADARRQTALLEHETAAIEADNLALQTSLRPRRLSFMGWTDNIKEANGTTEILKEHAGTTALIQAVPDFEAQLFARDIATVLEQAGWKTRFVNESQSHMAETSFPEGTIVFTLSDGKSETTAGTAVWSALTGAEVLMNGTGTFGAYISHKILEKPEPGYPYFDPPVTAVFIRIGLKPHTQQFLDIQRRNMERQDRRFDRSLRAAYDRGGSMLFGVPNHPPVAVRPGPDGEWIALNPEEQSLLPKRVSPTLILPGGIMLRSSPPAK